MVFSQNFPFHIVLESWKSTLSMTMEQMRRKSRTKLVFSNIGYPNFFKSFVTKVFFRFSWQTIYVLVSYYGGVNSSKCRRVLYPIHLRCCHTPTPSWLNVPFDHSGLLWEECLYNRTGVAGAVVQTASALIH